MKCCGSPWPEVLLYTSGMCFVVFGMGSLIVSVDPRPFDKSEWTTFLWTGICFFLVGSILLTLSATIPEMPGKTFPWGETHDQTFMSNVDLLEDVQSVGCADSPIIKLREANLRASEESIRTIRSCMMMQTPFSGSEGILFFKETIV